MERKAALIGNKSGPWIRTSGMRNLHVNLRVQRDVMVRVDQLVEQDGEPESQSFVGAGIRKLKDRTWTRVTIVDGPFEDALCLLQTVRAS